MDRVKRWFLNCLTPYVEYIAFYLVFPGGIVFYLLNNLYLSAFDYIWRQPLKKRKVFTELIASPAADDPIYAVYKRASEDSEVIGIRRIRMRTHCGNFLNREEALTAVQTSVLAHEDPNNNAALTSTASSAEFYLTGQPGQPDDTKSPRWSFLMRGSRDDVPDDWTLPSYREEEPWTAVSLPNHWQLQGFDIPMYTNTTYPVQFDPPRAVRNGTWANTACDLGLGGTSGNNIKLHPKEPGENATGLFRCTFHLPERWQNTQNAASGTTSVIEGNNKIFLHFAGVDSCLFVWMDGEFIGYSQDSCLPVEFDVTKLVASSADQLSRSHTLAVKVLRWCDGTYLEDQDKWWLSGIYREVYLSLRPAAHIADFEFQAIVNPTNSPNAPVLPSSAAVAPLDEQEIFNPTISTVRAIPDELATQVGERYSSCAMVTVSVLAEGLEQPHAVRVELWGTRYPQQQQEQEKSQLQLQLKQKPALVMTSKIQLSTASELPMRDIADQSTKSLFFNKHNEQKPIEFADKEVPVRQLPGRITLSGEVNNPKLWTAETPNLYAMIISLHRSERDAQENENAVHVVTHRVGLRNVSIGGSDNVLRVNGVPLTIAGMNRHEFSSSTGRAVSRALMVKDAKVLKKLNFNAVRSSHYPQHPFWLDVCDEIGLYVIDEANIETHGFQIMGQPAGYLASRADWESSMGSRIARMVERDKNHAAIIGWSLGNECGHGPTHNAMAAWLRARDPFRFSQYESGGSCTNATDIVCPMYQRPAWCKEQVATDGKKRPVILCEYAHAMGNSGGCLGKYWQGFRDPKLARFQGGFIWDFVDQGLDHPAGKGGYAYGGDFGDYPHTAQFCCNGIARPDRSLFPDAYEAAHLQAPVEVLLVTDDPSLGQIKATHIVDGASCNESFGGDEVPLMLMIVNRRMHTTLEDLSITVTPKVHGAFVDSMQSFSAFEIPCGKVLPGSFAVVPITAMLLKSLQDTRIRSEFDTALRDDRFMQPLLDLSVHTLPGSAVWHPESFELLHAALTNDGLATFMKKHASQLLLPDGTETQQQQVLPGAGRAGQLQIKQVSCSEPPTANELRLCSLDGLSPLLFKDRQSINVDLESDGILVRWPDGAQAKIGGRCGRLVSWYDREQRSLLATPIDACLYRAATDNDRGGMLLSYRERWIETGLSRLQRKLVHEDPSSGRSTAITGTVTLPDGRVKISTEWQFISPPDAKISLTFSCTAHYIFDPKGPVDVCIAVYPPLNMPPIGRCGLRWFMHSDCCDRVKWFGLGPHEAYDDRKASAYLGTFEATVNDLHTPYTFPQDNGRRADPRWIIFKRRGGSGGLVVTPLPEDRADDVWSTMLKDILSSSGGGTSSSLKRASKGCGLSNGTNNHTMPSASTTTTRSAGVSGWGFHASHYAMETLDAATHDYTLAEAPERDYVQVHVDSRSMGVGGYDSWSPNVDEEHLIKPTHVIDALPSLRNLSRKFGALPATTTAASNSTNGGNGYDTTAVSTTDVVTSTVNEIIKNGGVMGMHTSVRLMPLY